MEFPLAFVENMRNLLSDECDAFLSALMSDASVSVRVNDKLSLFGDKKPVPWCPDGYYLPERPSFTKDPLFHAGAYYVQEASSMFLYQALKQCVPHDAVVLDLCAAPGGKSTLASQYLSRGLLVANEIVRSRAYILSENIQKWGNDNVVVCNNRPADFASSGVIFDAILVDAPCSGEGMFRKDEGAIAEWSPANVHMCAERQREILTAIWPALKEGGILVYSTCTFNQEEDEENVRWIMEELGAEYVFLEREEGWNITTYGVGYRFFPHKTQGEGLFMAVLRKVSDDVFAVRKQKKNNRKQVVVAVPPGLSEWLADDYSLHMDDATTVRAYPKGLVDEMQRIVENMRVLSAGIEVAEVKGKSVVPQQGLALSKHIKRGYFPEKELSEEDALRYLRGEAFYIDDVPNGYVLLTYQSLPIGWGKNLGSRFNNLYPNEWRIKKM